MLESLPNVETTAFLYKGRCRLIDVNPWSLSVVQKTPGAANRWFAQIEKRRVDGAD